MQLHLALAVLASLAAHDTANNGATHCTGSNGGGNCITNSFVPPSNCDGGCATLPAGTKSAKQVSVDKGYCCVSDEIEVVFMDYYVVEIGDQEGSGVEFSSCRRADAQMSSDL
ncbi:hypothetical protein BU23DRAFT_573075 [Bimuria novae-zelandiae CBS 107.79]|uniref:Uncharacterized protein n=1 Tax=Bimuria novae-zelandiae CBS 107.79 TaxID=1447943 RepID=A0A6A5UXJ4_9PLEO|nr:hypothetical protein BU23DRAFT_573075 [Bimuria novae-zelandiae CBS 107.79]